MTALAEQTKHQMALNGAPQTANTNGQFSLHILLGSGFCWVGGLGEVLKKCTSLM